MTDGLRRQDSDAVDGELDGRPGGRGGVAPVLHDAVGGVGTDLEGDGIEEPGGPPSCHRRGIRCE